MSELSLSALAARIEELERRCDSLRGRVGVANTAAHYLLTTFEVVQGDPKGLLRAGLVDIVHRLVDDDGVPERVREAARRGAARRGERSPSGLRSVNKGRPPSWSRQAGERHVGGGLEPRVVGEICKLMTRWVGWPEHPLCGSGPATAHALHGDYGDRQLKKGEDRGGQTHAGSRAHDGAPSC